jgi:predicted DNA-binding protein YlxM (UPF0122 family)
MTDNGANRQGVCMAKSIEQRLALLEEQAEINRQAINAMIDRGDAMIEQSETILAMLKAGFGQIQLGKIKPGQIAKIERVHNVMKGDDEN